MNRLLRVTLAATLAGAALAACDRDASPPPATDAPAPASAATAGDVLAPLLPERVDVAAETEWSVYFDNVVLARDPEVYRFAVDCGCGFGRRERRRFVLAPGAGDAGRYPLHVTVSDETGKVLGEARSELRVVASDAGAGASYRYLSVGDSLGHQSRFPNAVHALLGRPGNPRVAFVGTHRPPGSAVAHEQYGGWTWRLFLEHFAPDAKAVYHTERSPFVFPDEAGGKPRFDLARYQREALGGSPPDFVTVVLGINDAFGAPSSDAAAFGVRVDEIFADAERLLGAFRAQWPDADLGVGIVIPANHAERTYLEVYRDPSAYTRWRRGQKLLAARMLAHFGGREGERIFAVPTHLNLDVIDGYEAHAFVPEGVDYEVTHVVHPSPRGDAQIGATLYGWLKGRFAVRAEPERAVAVASGGAVR